MKEKKYKHIIIKQVINETFAGKPMYRISNVKNQNDGLGLIFWYAPWCKYVFSQSKESVVFDVECLKNVIDFIETETGK